MRTVRILAFIPLAVMSLGACSDDSSAATDTTVAATITTVAAATTLATPASTTVDTAVAEDASSDVVLSGPVQIDVVIGRDSSPDRIERVTVGSDITLNITNPNADDEFHVHGVDIEQEAKAGQMATINFTIDTPGTYEVESHITEDVLVVIEAT
ncbi:MAG TPA: hypothetical protein PK020_11025 [Ilumatobacteraceae bacterium]|nr:hypothetical protein [Ilumatobacteraceae bacterium]HRB02949.1 hypothetical protein [Ilumatobacteraceae bacterium]